MGSLDRSIDAAQRKLAAIQGRETWALTAKEQTRLAGHATVVFARATRQKHAPGAEQGREQVWTDAETRLRADLAVAQAAKVKADAEAAAKRAAKKSAGWW